MARVIFVAHNERFDVKPAEVFGEVTYLMRERGVVSPFKTDAFIAQINAKLAELNYDPNVDFIALTGSTIGTSMLCGVIMAKHPRAKVLLFDAQQSCYVERTVSAVVAARPIKS